MAQNPAKYARAFNCPSCGGSLEIKAPGHTITLACQYCSSLIDVNTPEYSVIAKQKAAQKPTLPLGSRLQFDGQEWEVIGMQIKRDIQWKYSWEEILLYNPRYGFRWLSQYEGHFLLNDPIHAHFALHPTNLTQTWEKRYYKLYHKGRCETTYVLGEFYWRAKVGDQVAFSDFIAPPFNLNVEANEEEIAWTKGRYVSTRELRKACAQVPDLKLPPVKGISPAQPNPHKLTVRVMVRTLLLALVALIGLQIFANGGARNERVLDTTFDFATRGDEIAALRIVEFDTTKTFISQPFVLAGEIDNVEINTELLRLSNSWAEVYYTLVNETTGESFELAEVMEYYSGTDSDGSWSEGSQTESTLLNGVPGGTYHLEAQVLLPGKGPQGLKVNLIRGTVPVGNFFMVLLLLIVFPIFYRIRSYQFERKRWAESDHSPYSS